MLRSIDAGSGVLWNGKEPLGLLTFDERTCEYDVIVRNLKPNFQYKWKMVVGNAWSENYGCTGLNAADCSFKTNSIGAIRMIVKPVGPPQLKTDYNVFECGGF